MALRLCATPGCAHTVTKGHCPTHRRQREQQRYNADTRKWYYTLRWQQLRLWVLGMQPICQACHHSPSTEVDHITPHRGNPDLFWARDNLQGLCGTCHRRKTQRGE